jgi:hypothetical protein
MFDLIFGIVIQLLWLLFVLSPCGGLYYWLRSYLLNLQRQRNRLLQCSTNDDLHYVSTRDGWRIAVVHYKARTDASTKHKYPVLLCHGLSSNRLAYDMGADQVSFARYLANEGFDVFAIELRGKVKKTNERSTGNMSRVVKMAMTMTIMTYHSIFPNTGSNLPYHPQFKSDLSFRQYDFDDILEQDIPASIDFILQHW